MIRIKKILFPLLILLFSGIIIFYRFPFLPKYLAFDEVEFSKLALSLANKPYVTYSPLATGHSTLYFYIMLLSFKIFGITQFALRLPSALSGILGVLAFYAILKLIVKRDLPVFAGAVILITSRWFFGFARFAFEPTFLLFLELTSLLFIISWLKHPKGVLKPILSGAFAGLAFNSYTPGRIFFLLPLVFIIFFSELKKRPRFFNFQIFKSVLAFLIPFIILATPLQYYLLFHQDIRIYQLSYLQNSKLPLQQKISFLTENIESTVNMFVMKGDPNGKHNYPYKPAINPIVGLLTLAGILLALKHVRKKENTLFLGYFFLSVLPTLLVYPWENPSMLRTYTMLPGIAYFAALPLAIILNQKKFFKKKVFVFAFVTLIILSSLYEMRTYFIYQAKVFQHSFEVKQNLTTAIHCPNLLKCIQ